MSSRHLSRVYNILQFNVYILHFILRYIILIKKCKRYLVILRGCQLYIGVRLKLQPEDGFMNAETCTCCVLLINHILCNTVVLGYKFIYYIKPDVVEM